MNYDVFDVFFCTDSKCDSRHTSQFLSAFLFLLVAFFSTIFVHRDTYSCRAVVLSSCFCFSVRLSWLRIFCRKGCSKQWQSSHTVAPLFISKRRHGFFAHNSKQWWAFRFFFEPHRRHLKPSLHITANRHARYSMESRLVFLSDFNRPSSTSFTRRIKCAFSFCFLLLVSDGDNGFTVCCFLLLVSSRDFRTFATAFIQ